MHYQPRDRSPILDIGYWPEKLVVWHDQSLPEDISEEGGRSLHGFLGAVIRSQAYFHHPSGQPAGFRSMSCPHTLRTVSR
jgi:hypothetical protein